jgi:DNA-binding transcriptional LysR family regulator
MNFLTFDLNLLRVFDAVMTEQNLTRAASQLALTQPAVSNALKRLRDALGDELFIRTTHGVKATPHAEELWPAIRRALSDLERVVAPTEFDISKVQVTLRIAMADATAVVWLPELVRAIEMDAPGINVRTVPLITRDPRPMLLAGDIDIAIGFFPGVVAQLSGGPYSPIRHERLGSGKYICVMRKNHPLADKELTVDAYCSANHLLVSLSGRAHGLSDVALAQLNRERRILLTVNQFFTAISVVENSDLITVLPLYIMTMSDMTGSLILKELPFKLPDIYIDLLWHERDARNLAFRWLRKRLTSFSSSESLKNQLLLIDRITYK